MISVFIACTSCRGIGGYFDLSFGTRFWKRCVPCDGIGRDWAPGAPTYGCSITLADRDPGEVVTLGNGDRGKIAWHMPRKKKKIRPETTFLLLIDDFTEAEDPRPRPYPSRVGVASVDVSRQIDDAKAHDRERSLDYNDPIHRHLVGRLM